MRSTPSALLALLLMMPGLAFGEVRTPSRGPDPEIRPRRQRPPASEPGSVTDVRPNPPVVAPNPVTAPTGMRYVIESGGVSFGELLPDQAAELTGAVRIVVTSDTEWALKLVAPPQFILSQEGQTVSISRMQWRSPLSGSYVPFQSGLPVIVARGPATIAGVTVITLDLRLHLQTNDPVGQYGCAVRVFLEPL